MLPPQQEIGEDLRQHRNALAAANRHGRAAHLGQVRALGPPRLTRAARVRQSARPRLARTRAPAARPPRPDRSGSARVRSASAIRAWVCRNRRTIARARFLVAARCPPGRPRGSDSSSSARIHRAGSRVPASSIRTRPARLLELGQKRRHRPAQLGIGHVAQQPQSLGHLLDGSRRQSVMPQPVLHPADRLRIEPIGRSARRAAAARASGR